jgi:hypothetical protein
LKYETVPSHFGHMAHRVRPGFNYSFCGTKVDRDKVPGRGEATPALFTCMRCVGWHERATEYERIGFGGARLPKATRAAILQGIRRLNGARLAVRAPRARGANGRGAA